MILSEDFLSREDKRWETNDKSNFASVISPISGKENVTQFSNIEHHLLEDVALQQYCESDNEITEEGSGTEESPKKPK